MNSANFLKILILKNICERLLLTLLINFTTSSEFQNQLAQFKELQLELGEMNEIKDSLVREMREMEKRMKATEQETEILQDKLKSSERSRRAVRFHFNISTEMKSG